MTITAKHIRAARGLLKWTQQDLADKAIISINTVKNIENEASIPRPTMVEKIKKTFEKAGVEFTKSGVRRVDDKIKIYEGPEQIAEFFFGVHQFCAKTGGPVFVDGVEEKKFAQLKSKEDSDKYLKNMALLKDVDFRVILEKGKKHEYKALHVQYREVYSEFFSPVVYYIYGDVVAIVLWGEVDKIIAIRDPDLFRAYKRQFDLNWERSTAVKFDNAKLFY